ncbi:uncharacterized protein N7483_009053 [Penicillium malachiteum]|uniref:uncharacterized protein n=1 Tax=Penicillium malachiteum TaxID=1324776 RepID=UPI002546EA6C|nr:uncharacterized protein N7483_009053 [Penicillium malachiteum]KAJ5721119.1 hypothetical protein N7483_009053 [Penicillium malachiteum]
MDLDMPDLTEVPMDSHSEGGATGDEESGSGSGSESGSTGDEKSTSGSTSKAGSIHVGRTFTADFPSESGSTGDEESGSDSGSKGGSTDNADVPMDSSSEDGSTDDEEPAGDAESDATSVTDSEDYGNSVRWHHLIDYLADHLRQYVLGLQGEDEPGLFTTDQFVSIQEDLLDEECTAGVDEVYEYATKTRFQILPETVKFEVLDRLFNFHQEDKEGADMISIHCLHSLRSMSTDMRTLVDRWLEESHEKWEKLSEWEFQHFYDRDVLRGDLSHPWNPKAYHVPHLEETNLAIQAATSCAGCFEMLVSHGVIVPDAYDINGKSLLRWALEHKCQDVVRYITNNAELLGDFFEVNNKPGEAAEKHPLLLLIEYANLEGFEILFKRLKKANIFSTQPDLLKLLNVPSSKLGMCKFVTAKLALNILDRTKINIGDVGPAVNGKKDDVPSTTSWHEAARFNPDGEAFMDFLLEFSGFDGQNSYSRQHLTPLMYAAYADNPSAFKWLLKNEDSSSAGLPNRSDARPPYVVKIVAQNFNYGSDEMFRATLDILPEEFFEDYMMIKEVFGYIIDGLTMAGYRNDDPNGKSAFLPENRVLTMFLAADKCQELVNRLPEDWISSAELYQTVSRARSFGYSFLPPSLIKQRDGSRNKPDRMVLPEGPKPLPFDFPSRRPLNRP